MKRPSHRGLVRYVGRIVVVLTFLFAGGIIAVTARFVLTEPPLPQTTDTTTQSKVINRGLFDQTTKLLQQKTSIDASVDPHIRDPFSPAYVPPPPAPPAPAAPTTEPAPTTPAQ